MKKIIVLILALITNYFNCVSGAIKLSGNLTCSFLDGAPSFAGTTNWFEGYLSEDDFVIRCGAIGDPRVDRFEYGSFEKGSSYQMIAFRQTPDSPLKGRNQMTLSLFPTWQPERNTGFYIPLWMLVAGGRYFRADKVDEIVLIGEYPPRAFEAKKKMRASWLVQDSFLTEFVEFGNGELFLQGPYDNLVTEKAPQLIGTTNILYRVLETTNFNGLRVPIRFVYHSFHVKSKSETPRLLQTIEGTVTSVTNDTLPKRTFSELTKVQVNDRRLVHGDDRLPAYSYFVTNGSIRPLNTVPEITRKNLLIESEKRKGMEARVRPYFLSFGLLALFLPILWLVARRKVVNKHEHPSQ
jgi:hypothetical protein